MACVYPNLSQAIHDPSHAHNRELITAAPHFHSSLWESVGLSRLSHASGLRNNCGYVQADTRAMSRFIAIDRDTAYLLPSISEWLPENHLARLVVEVIDRLDLS